MIMKINTKMEMKMKISRRRFAETLGAVAMAPSLVVGADEKPLARLGVITDTHIGNTKASCARVRLAYELFRELSVDMIANVGDIADKHFPAGYAAYREMIEEVYAGMPAERRPKELFVYAGHDVLCYKPGILHDFPSDAAAGTDMKRLLKIPNDFYAEGEVNGFPYVAIPQSGFFVEFDEERFGRMVSAAVAKHPGKPVFVFTHVTPNGTTRDGHGAIAIRRVLNRYPQVVCLSGHTHGSLRSERSIWQGEFTVVSAGCLQNWGLGLPGEGPVERMQNYGALVLDVFANRIVVRRFDVRDRDEDAPWIVPWPHDPATAPYRPELRRKTLPVPAFAPGAAAQVKVAPDAAPFSSLDVTFPCADGASVRPFAYRLELSRKESDGAWTTFARKFVFGEFHLRAFERPATITCKFDATYFDAGRDYRVAIAPRNSLGGEGADIVHDFTAPAKAVLRKLVWKTDDPARDCVFRNDGVEKSPGRDGFFDLKGEQSTLSFPDGVWDGPEDARFLLTFDMHTVQHDTPCWAVALLNLKPTPRRGEVKAFKYAAQMMRTLPGDSGVLRYVVEFEKPAAACTYALLLVGGRVGKVRFTCAKIERLEDRLKG